MLRSPQIKEEILRKIVSQEWSENQRIPSVRELSLQYGSNKLTVQKAIQALSEDGVIKCLARQGNYVASANIAEQLLTLSGNLQIAFVLPRWIHHGKVNPSYAEFLAGAEKTAATARINLNYLSLPWEKEEKKFSIKEMAFALERVAGVLLVGPTPENIAEKFINACKVPVVLVDNVVDIPNVTCVSSDNLSGGIRAVEYLLHRGHHRIGMVAMDPLKLRVNERFAGFFAAMHRVGLTDQIAFVKQAAWDQDTFDGGYAMGKELIRDGFNGATAILTVNDNMAMGVMQAFHENNIRIPDDISIMGIGDEPGADILCRPPLTTLRVNREKIGSYALQALLSIIQKRSTGGVIILHPMTLIERESIADCPIKNAR